VKNLSKIEKRKEEHIKLSLSEKVEADISTGFEHVRLVHRSLPQIALSDVDTQTILFGKKLRAPLIISALTGGTKKAEEINGLLARVAQKEGIGLSVGSQRVAIEHPETASSFTIVRENAPDVFVMGNLGAPQLAMGWGLKEINKCIEMVKADAMAIHMNPLQEAIQINGDTDYRDILRRLNQLALGIKIPLILKETGCGISFEDAVKLQDIGVQGLEISGLGGTSWAAIEHYIARNIGDNAREALGLALWNWGIPTVISLIESSRFTDLKIIASGGIRTGTEMAKSIVLGADAVGIARPVLEKAMEGEAVLRRYVNQLINELKVVMFLVGASNIEELKKVPAVILGTTAEWLRYRGINPEEYALRKV
jgi:isopentenyl-diphosphate delta-isomerase